MSRERVVARAPAKLNLELRVLARRPDGYHELSSLLVALEHADRVALLPRAPGAPALAVTGPAASADVPADRTNLAWRALEAVCALAGADPEAWSLAVWKRVPSGAGLGGGSADAAAAALAAATALGLGPAHDAAIAERLAALGSDCPFFHAARASGLARCRGRGERVEPLPPPASARAFCVLTPDVHCSTAAVYRAWSGASGAAAPAELAAETVFAAPLARARAALANDLEAPALATHPALASLRALLDASGAEHFRLTGSGASFYGLFEDRAAAERARRALTGLAEGAHIALRSAFVSRAANVGATLESSN